jgi:hypothetical protein
MRLNLLHSHARRAGALIGLAGAALLATPAVAQNQAPAQHRVEVHPYLEVEQVMSADFDGSGDVLTYTSVGAGIEASIETRKVHATVDYNYQHYFGWKKGSGDSGSHEGIAAARIDVVDNVLAIDAGGLATRSHGDIRAAGPGLRSNGNNDLADIYSGYVGPSLSTHAGNVAVNASYHLGYVKVDDDDISRGSVAGRSRVDRYTSSTVHQADVSVGMDTNASPVGWTVAGGWAHEDMNRFKSRYDGKYARADVVVPVSSNFAVTGGVGYEDIKASQQDIQRDAAGAPVVTASGNVIADPSKPRLVTYDDDGLIWDAGIIWRPSPRTEAQARFGRRYGSNTYLGSFRTQLSRSYSFNAVAYDEVSSFGRLLVSDLNGVPRNFNIRRNPLFSGIGPGGCVFGSQAGTGTCFDNALQSVANFNFRNRGANAMISGGEGPWSFGIGAGYANRRYITPRNSAFALDRVTDQSITLDAVASRELRNSGYDIETFAGWYDSGLAGEPSSFTTGATFSYYRSLMGDHLQGNIAAGVYNSDAGSDNGTVGSILLGLRYTF